MLKQYEQVKAFHTAFDEPMPKTPTVLSKGPMITNNWLSAVLEGSLQDLKAISSHTYKGEQIGGLVAKRVSWMLEEIAEFAAADTIEDQADALIDLIYFAIGTFTLMGVNPEPLFDIVHAANMGKVGPDGKVLRNEQGKIIKPEGWKERYSPEPLLAEEIELQCSAVGSAIVSQDLNQVSAVFKGNALVLAESEELQ